MEMNLVYGNQLAINITKSIIFENNTIKDGIMKIKIILLI